MLKIYNSLTRTTEPFVPLEPPRVRMYVCGMTVYDYCHLGHARVLIAFDVVQRWLRASGYQLTYARNITDIDDKIIKRAAENKEPIDALTARFIEAMHEDLRALGGNGQGDGVEFRRARLYFEGTLHEHLLFKAQYDFAGGGVGFRNVWMAFKGTPLGTLTVGSFGADGVLPSKVMLAAKAQIEKIFVPPKGQGAEIVSGTTDEVVAKLVGKIKELGLL